MNDYWQGITKLADVFFNGRPAEKDCKVTLPEIIRRKTSLVRFEGKLYRVVATEVEYYSK